MEKDKDSVECRQILVEIVKLKYGRSMAKMKCNQCGSEFMIDIRLYKKGNGVYCSPECRCESRKVTPLAKKCLNCGKALPHRRPSGRANPRQVFCNLRCASRFTAKITTDEQKAETNRKRKATWDKKIEGGWRPNAG